MTTYYVGSGGDNGNNGTTWALRKLTLNGAEDIPVAAGDTVYVGAGSYAELLTCDVDGGSGSLITYIGDYTGANTDGVGGLVRITGSDNGSSGTRANCINVNSKDYRKFSGFHCDGCTGVGINALGDYCDINTCFIQNNNVDGGISSASGATYITIDKCCVFSITGTGIRIVGGSAYDSHSIVTNCLVVGGAYQYYPNYAGGLLFKNCTAFASGNQGFRFLNQSTDYPSEIYNCLIYAYQTGIYCNAASVVTENYNTIISATARTNVAAGANSNTYLQLTDSRWFFELVNGGRMISPFDIASYSAHVNLAGTSPTTADMRGTTVQGAQREWGALEYDSTLLAAGAVATAYHGRMIGC